MRFVSDDGKVFNTEEECKQHEQSLKNKAKNSAKNQQEDKKEIESVLDTHQDILDEIDHLVEMMDDYMEMEEELMDHCVDLIKVYNDKYDDSHLRLVVTEDEEGESVLQLVECDGNCDDCDDYYD